MLLARLKTVIPFDDVEILLVTLGPEMKNSREVIAFVNKSKELLTKLIFCSRMILSLIIVLTLILVNVS